MSANPKPLIYSFLFPLPFGNHKFVYYVYESVSVLQISSFVSFFLDLIYKRYHVIFVFLFLLGSKFFFAFRATPTAYRGSQARGQVCALATAMLDP